MLLSERIVNEIDEYSHHLHPDSRILLFCSTATWMTMAANLWGESPVKMLALAPVPAAYSIQLHNLEIVNTGPALGDLVYTGPPRNCGWLVLPDESLSYGRLAFSHYIK